MQARWILVFSSACGSRARARTGPWSAWSRSASTEASLREKPLSIALLIDGPSAGSGAARGPARSVCLCRPRKTASASRPAARVRSWLLSSRRARQRAVDRGRHRGIVRQLERDLRVQRVPRCRRARQRPRRRCGWRRARRARAAKPSRSIVSSPMRTFFSDDHLGVADEQQLRRCGPAPRASRASNSGPVSITTASKPLRAASRMAASSAAGRRRRPPPGRWARQQR